LRKNITAKELEKIIRYNIPKRYPLGDNLYLDISGGSAVFSFRYKINGKQHKKSLKPFHKVHNTLAHARANALHLKAKVRQGIDPKEEELRARREADEKLAAQQLIDQKRQSTFQILANNTIAYLEHEWTNPKTRKQWESSLSTYAFPVIGHLPVADISREHVLEILEPIWYTKTETADRVRRRIETVLRRAIAEGLRSYQNPAAWRGCLEHRLPSAEKTKNKRKPIEERHHKALPYGELPRFMTELVLLEGIGARALEFLILNANRSDEVLSATWDEFNLEEGTWTIPARRMKSKVSHTIPMSSQSLLLLNNLPRHLASEFVFPNVATGRSLSQAGMSSVLKRMGKAGEITVHGFRSTFRDYIAEQTDFDGAIAERALAHSLKNKAEAAYQRGRLIQKRREMMQVYSDFAYETATDKSFTWYD